MPPPTVEQIVLVTVPEDELVDGLGAVVEARDERLPQVVLEGAGGTA